MEPKTHFDMDRAESGLVRPYVAALTGRAVHRGALLGAWDRVALPDGPAPRTGSPGRVDACPARHGAPSRLRRPLVVAGLGAVLCAVGFALPALGAGEPPEPAGVAAPAQGYLTTTVSPSAEPPPEPAATPVGATRTNPARPAATAPGGPPPAVSGPTAPSGPTAVSDLTAGSDPTTAAGPTGPRRVRRPAGSAAPGASTATAPGAVEGSGPAPAGSTTPSAAATPPASTGSCVDLLGITVGVGDC